MYISVHKRNLFTSLSCTISMIFNKYEFNSRYISKAKSLYKYHVPNKTFYLTHRFWFESIDFLLIYFRFKSSTIFLPNQLISIPMFLNTNCGLHHISYYLKLYRRPIFILHILFINW